MGRVDALLPQLQQLAQEWQHARGLEVSHFIGAAPAQSPHSFSSLTLTDPCAEVQQWPALAASYCTSSIVLLSST